MRDIAAGQPEDLNLAQLPVWWFGRDEQPQCVERHVHAAWGGNTF